MIPDNMEDSAHTIKQQSNLPKNRKMIRKQGAKNTTSTKNNNKSITFHHSTTQKSKTTIHNHNISKLSKLDIKPVEKSQQKQEQIQAKQQQSAEQQGLCELINEQKAVQYKRLAKLCGFNSQIRAAEYKKQRAQKKRRETKTYVKQFYKA